MSPDPVEGRPGRRPGPVRRLVSSGGLVVRSDGAAPQVALIRHQTLRGTQVWTFPKGQVERGESVEEAALREVREETGLEAEIVTGLPPLSYWYSMRGVRHRKTVHLFLMRMLGGDPADHDHEVEEVGFFPFAEAIRRASYTSERRVLEQAAELVSRW